MKSKRIPRVRKVAVLGAGVMGSALACHMANAGMEVLLLDIVTPGLSEEERASKQHRDRLVNENLERTLRSKPSPIFTQSLRRYIQTGNFEDDLPKIADCDWIIEAVVERLDIKRSLFERVEQYRRADAIVSSNTSGIPIHMMAEGRSAEFRAHFLGTHFFNPPRYMQLLELIPGPDTDPAIVQFMQSWGDRILGKTTVVCKDTPGFIANRIGVYAMAKIFELAEKYGLTPAEVDKLTGPLIGRPKTGTFRLGDLVGLDVAVKVIEDLKKHLPHDSFIQQLRMPKFVEYLIQKRYFGNKSGRGFYYKTDERDERGKRIIQQIDFESFEYHPVERPNLEILATAKALDSVAERLRLMFKSDDRGSKLVREHFLSLFAYASHCAPEIADSIYDIDRAMKAGFNWQYGPFEYWDMLGLEETVGEMQAEGYPPAPWVEQMLEQGITQFYRREGRQRQYYDFIDKRYAVVPDQMEFLVLSELDAVVWQNEEIRLHDIGDGVLCVEFTSPNNTIGEGVLRGLDHSITLAEEEGWQGVVIGNNAEHFSVGANLMLIGMMAFQKQFDQLDEAVRMFQRVNMRLRYAAVPVVAAVQGYTFGGGVEMMMHCDRVVAAAESYIGLVEVGVGLIPGGGGTKEFALRISESFHKDDNQIPLLIEGLRTLATATVATSALEAYEHKYLLRYRDTYVMHRQRNLTEAKKAVLQMAPYYVPPRPTEVTVLGRTGLGACLVAINELYRAGWATEYDAHIAKKLAWVLCGGDITGQQTVSEWYLLDLEREAFLSLCGEAKTLERIQYMLEHKKPLRN